MNRCGKDQRKALFYARQINVFDFATIVVPQYREERIRCKPIPLPDDIAFISP